MAALPELGDWKSKEELHALQRTQLPAVLARARATPFYGARLGNGHTAADWSAVPFTTKEDLREAYPFGMLGVETAELATYHESSGTTGDPTPSYLTEDDWYDICTRFNRNAVNVQRGDMVIVRSPYSMLTTALQMHRAAELREAVVVPADNRSWIMPHAKVARLMHDLPITVAWWIPTNSLVTAAAARQAGYAPERDFPSLRSLVVAGEFLSEVKRSYIERLWGGIDVYQDYGSTETGSIAGECSHKKLHIWADRLLCEVYDPATGQCSREGTGQLVITPLYRKAMPLLRYFLGDTVDISHEHCACGWHLPTIRVHGRTVNQFEVQGRTLFPVQLEEAVFSLPTDLGVLFWRARHGSYGLRIEIECEPHLQARAKQALADLVQQQLGVQADVAPVAPGTIVPLSTLAHQATPLKPKYVFADDEPWATEYPW